MMNFVELLDLWMGNENRKLDTRKLSRQDLKMAIQIGLILRANDPQVLENAYDTRGAHTYVFNNKFNPVYDLPVDLLFRVLAPALVNYTVDKVGTGGNELENNPIWYALNVYPLSSRFSKEREYLERRQVMGRLHDAQYIKWVQVGTDFRWMITLTERGKALLDQWGIVPTNVVPAVQ